MNKNYVMWMQNESIADKYKEELKNLSTDEIEERFFKYMDFGTAGLRGKIGAGTNMMNIYTVSLAAKAIAQVLHEDKTEASIAISYDTRHFSKEFAFVSAKIMAMNKIKVYIFEEAQPTPLLSYAVRYFKADAGIMVTASHNPKDYNGYKVYNNNGSQILEDVANRIQDKMKNNKIEAINYSDADDKYIEYISEDYFKSYYSKLTEIKIHDDIDKEIKIAYSPLNGTGLKPCTKIMQLRGFKNISIVKEEEYPDPDFKSCPYPNPETEEAMTKVKKLAAEINADLAIATDPDSDRLNIAIKDKDSYKTLNGNIIGAMLVNYIVNENKDIKKKSYIVKSIVTGDMAKDIASKKGVDTIEVLTGFKNICEIANEFENDDKNNFLFGYEESIGYVYKDFVRDKDAVNSCMMICEMCAYYKKQGKSLSEVLNSLYEEFGYYKEKLISLSFEGIKGMETIKRIMNHFRENKISDIAGLKIINVHDYLKDKNKRLQADVLKYTLEDKTSFAIRPSGTEPKIKLYVYSYDKVEAKAVEKLEQISNRATEIMKSFEL